ncbi:SAM-dependent methyltransferase [Actinomadura sp. NPDC023710]|uniref:SAM-dependent methyltransferase n=1 Tax=Actinomadura sp. NPDC023710 TaxID=3158219 RepID=UPI0033EF95B6
MADETFLPDAVDLDRPAPARVYVLLLGGRTALAADRPAYAQVIAKAPDAGAVAQENYKFAGRATAQMVQKFGISQVINIGPGIQDPDITLPSVEQCVRAVAPDAVVVAFDNDHVVLTHARTHSQKVLFGDVTDLDTIFGNPTLGAVLDLAEPVVVVLAAVLHFVDDAVAVMAGLARRLAPGSVVVMSHATSTGPESMDVAGVTKAYDDATSRIHFRSEEEILGLCAGWEILGPGLKDVAEWGLPEDEHGQVGEFVRVVGMAARLPGRER